MKPENWDKLSNKEKKEIANELFMSIRGRYIISQALHYAIKELKKVKPPFREVSNIEDMEMLMETYFSIFDAVKKAEEEFKIKTELKK